MIDDKKEPEITTVSADNKLNPVTKKDYVYLFMIGAFFYLATYFLSGLL